MAFLGNPKNHVSTAIDVCYPQKILGQAIAHLCVASLMALLCDGCRVDGFGFGSVPVDQLLWRFGLLVLNALQLKDLEWEKAGRGPGREGIGEFFCFFVFFCF